MNWKNLLESVSESLNDHLQLRHDYLVAENRILRFITVHFFDL